MEPFRISVVCTANRFRSVVVAATLRDTLAGMPVIIDGMAANGPSGQPAIAEVVTALAAAGIDVSGHTSRGCAPGLLGAADLVIGFEAHHAAVAVAEAGAARERTFLLRELLDILPPLAVDAPRAPDEARAFIDRIGRFRMPGFFEPRNQYADPVAGPRRRYPEAVAELRDMAGRVGVRIMGLAEPDPVEPPRRRRGWLRR